MPVQIEPESPVGMRMRMLAGAVSPETVPACVPQSQRHPLPGLRPGRRRPHHQPQRHAVGTSVAGTGARVTGQTDGEAGTEQPVGGAPGHVPAQQIGRKTAQIGTEAGDEFGAVATSHGAQIEIDVDPGSGTRPRPVADRTPCGRSLDHGRWHGVLTDALPHQQSGRNPVREVMCHQHSP